MLKRTVLLFLALDVALAAGLYLLPYMVVVIASWAFVISYVVWNEFRGRGLYSRAK
jgi:hypothetical protein